MSWQRRAWVQLLPQDPAPSRPLAGIFRGQTSPPEGLLCVWLYSQPPTREGDLEVGTSGCYTVCHLNCLDL